MKYPPPYTVYINNVEPWSTHHAFLGDAAKAAHKAFTDDYAEIRVTDGRDNTIPNEVVEEAFESTLEND